MYFVRLHFKSLSEACPDFLGGVDKTENKDFVSRRSAYDVLRASDVHHCFPFLGGLGCLVKGREDKSDFGFL